MKKRTAVLVLATVLSLSVVGCGNSAEPKQETTVGTEQEADAGVEQEKKNIETDNFVFLSEAGEKEYLLEEFEWEETFIEFTTQYETNIYNIDGRHIGYIKPDVSVEITEHGINSGWYRFKNPESGTDYEYICVLRDDVEAQGGEAQQVQDENGAIDTEMIYIYPEDYEYGNDKEISPDLTWTECDVEFTNRDVLQLYDDDGKNIGWLHNVTVTFTEENDEWYRFKNTESNIDSEYLLVAKSSIESQNKNFEYEEKEKLYNEAIELFDENKTYTYDEFYILMQDAANIIGVEFSADVANSSYPQTLSLNLSSKELKNKFEGLVSLMAYGPAGTEKMDMWLFKEENTDTSGEFEIYLYLRFHKEEEQ